MGLFDEELENITKNYVRVIDVIERLYEKSDQGWYEILHFLINSSIDSIDTYSYDEGIVPKIEICNEVPVEKAYENEINFRKLKEALCAFIANNCDDLDGNHFENKIIAENEFTKKFKQYRWLKSDFKKLKEFQNLKIIEIIEEGKPLRNPTKIIKSVGDFSKQNKRYEELIYCIIDFCGKFNTPVSSFAKILKSKKFHKQCDVHICVGKDDFLKLNKINSEKAISYVLDFLDDAEFNSTRLEMDADYYHLIHILIDEDDLLYFEPLKDMIVDVRLGHDLYENIRYGNLKLHKLDSIREYHYQETSNFFDAYWEKLEKTHEEQKPFIPSYGTNIHPSLDPAYKNHAPELLIAMEAWEAKYLKNEYPHHEHTPAITNFLKNKNITQVNLVKRICAITNPKK